MASYYTVKRGDTLSGIALSQCGDASLWKKIYYDNIGVIGDDPDFILPGQVLYINCVEPGIVYVVKSGDNLTLIAQKVCGNSDWQKIYNQNKDVIGDNPDLIFPGQVLVIRC
ncbi:MAG: LysM peptidoglycan-binding domain-containing protein [Crocosphaera sp.]|nr:LysM peptidoglycan-binding domain-containing protein [Crocosphaera sp.]